MIEEMMLAALHLFEVRTGWSNVWRARGAAGLRPRRGAASGRAAAAGARPRSTWARGHESFAAVSPPVPRPRCSRLMGPALPASPALSPQLPDADLLVHLGDGAPEGLPLLQVGRGGGASGGGAAGAGARRKTAAVRLLGSLPPSSRPSHPPQANIDRGAPRAGFAIPKRAWRDALGPAQLGALLECLEVRRCAPPLGLPHRALTSKPTLRAAWRRACPCSPTAATAPPPHPPRCPRPRPSLATHAPPPPARPAPCGAARPPMPRRRCWTRRACWARRARGLQQWGAGTRSCWTRG